MSKKTPKIPPMQKNISKIKGPDLIPVLAYSLLATSNMFLSKNHLIQETDSQRKTVNVSVVTIYLLYCYRREIFISIAI